jgi:hypothetical protein
MTNDLHSKVDVMCEILKRVEEKVTIQNGNVARLTEWRIQHTEQTAEATRKIDRVEDKIKTLEPVISALKHPRIVLLAVVAFVLLTVKSSLTSAVSLLGI